MKAEKDFDYMIIDNLNIPTDTSENMIHHNEIPSSQTGVLSKEISLRPQIEGIEKIFPKNLMTLEREIYKLHYEKMIELYKAQDIVYMIVDKSCIYPYDHFLKGWYDFGSLTTIYLTTLNFFEIKQLPTWLALYKNKKNVI